MSSGASLIVAEFDEHGVRKVIKSCSVILILHGHHHWNIVYIVKGHSNTSCANKPIYLHHIVR